MLMERWGTPPRQHGTSHMRDALAATLALLLLGPPALAQGTAEQTVKNDPAAQLTPDPQPTPQGARAPNNLETETQKPDLQRLVQQVWAAPVDLQGNPIAAGTGQTAQPGPAAATAEGCGTTGPELAARPGASPAPCPPGSTEPAAPSR
jgi:hypothetical protein